MPKIIVDALLYRAEKHIKNERKFCAIMKKLTKVCLQTGYTYTPEQFDRLRKIWRQL